MSAEVIIWGWGGRVEVVEGEGVSWGEREVGRGWEGRRRKRRKRTRDWLV